MFQCTARPIKSDCMAICAATNIEAHLSHHLSLTIAPRTPGGPRPAGLTMDSATLDQFSAPQGAQETRPAGGAGAPGRRPRGPKPRLAAPVFPKLPGLTKRLGDLLGRRTEAKEEGRSMGQRSVSACLIIIIIIGVSVIIIIITTIISIIITNTNIILLIYIMVFHFIIDIIFIIIISYSYSSSTLCTRLSSLS